MNRTQLKRVLIGRPFPSSAETHERLDKVRGLAIFASDTISSNAYATEAVMGILVIMGSGALAKTLPVAVAISILIAIVVFSYRQTIMHYPQGGGAYTVSRDNLGTNPSLIAAAALLTDYVLTVSVSTSAGVRALTSAFPVLFPYRVLFAVGAIALITWVNLRGVRESGSVFALPTYAFAAGMYVVIVIGLVRWFGILGAAPLVTSSMSVPPAGVFSQIAMVWLVLRAFAAGCTALTGIEAVSNGVQAFKPPESRNAAQTMVAMGAIAITLLLGIAFLSTHLRIVPTEENSVLSQMTGAVAGRGVIYFWVQAFTMLILFLAANTGYQDFPRLSAFLARDGFMPRWLQNRGDRLVYSSGILVLAALSTTIVIIYGANEIAMLPLYAIGVMASFTLSQSGMVRLMGKVGKIPKGESLTTMATTVHFEPGWWWKRIVNAVGATVTCVVLLVLIATKFVEGAWIVLLAVAGLVYLFKTINHHYSDVAAKLSTQNLDLHDLSTVADVVIVPIADIHRGTLRALKYARRISPNVRVVHVSTDEASKARVLERWQRFREFTEGLQLVDISYEYRDVIEPLVEYIEHVNNVEFPHQLTTVVVPEFIPRTLREQLLHNQTANILRNRLRHYPDIVIIHVPHHL